MNKVSVVIATYNGEKFIEEQLDSLFEQTYIPDEILIFDDKSKDNTLQIVQKYIEKKDKKNVCVIFENEYNKGYAQNFYDGVCKAKNELIFFCDQDDIWDKNKIFNMMNVMNNNSSINLLCSNLEPFYYEKNTRKWDKKILKEMKNDEKIEIKEISYENFHLKRSGCTMCIRKSFLNEIKPYWINNWAHDDFVWKMAMVTSTCAIYHNVTVKRRMHSNNATVIRCRTKDKRILQLEDMKKQYNSLEKFCIDNNVVDNNIEILTRNQESLTKRLDLLNNKNILSWFDLFINYRNCYPRVKGLFLDIYLSFFTEYKGV